MNIFRPKPRAALALYMQAGCFTFTRLVAGQGEWHLLALTQSPSLSQLIRTLKEHLSSRKIMNLSWESQPSLALSLNADSYQRLTLNLPQHIETADILPTLSWLLQQQGFTPLTQWQWDFQLGSGHENEINADILLLEKSALMQIMQTLGLSLAQVSLICPASDLQSFAEPAVGVLEHYPQPGPLLNTKAAEICIQTALAASKYHHA